jgi:phosphatidylinositol alpha-1,6-mannosyltransferase
MMEQICLSLGPDKVSCLTGIRATQGSKTDPAQFRLYRRPSAFSGHKYFQAISLLEVLMRVRPRIIQLGLCYDGYIGLLVKRWLSIPFVIYAHGNEILEASKSDWDKPRLALRQASCVLANSRFTASLVEKAGVSPTAIRVIPLGCDTERFRPRAPNDQLLKKLLGHRAKGPIILTVGNLVERKGHDMVVRALPAIRKLFPEVTYVIVGSGPFKKDLEDMAFSLGVRDQVVFAGKASDEELPDFYSLCDVFAMPSRARIDAGDVEGFGLVFLEAAACGKPAVGGRSGGVEDAVVDGVTGLLVDPCDAEDVGRAILSLLGKPDLRGELGRHGRDRVEREYTWKVAGSRIQEILEQICAG